MDNYYVRIAKDADGWARGLTMINGGENLLVMADDLETFAKTTSISQRKRNAYRTLATALRRHVQAVQDYRLALIAPGGTERNTDD